MSTPVIRIEHLTKRYRDTTAVDDISLELEAGSICGLLGPNGAGKTTTFKCLLGFVQPTSGSVAIDGKPITAATFETTAFVPERAVLYDWLTIGDHLALQRRAVLSFDDAMARTLLDRFSLDPRKRPAKLSKGMRTALAVVLAFASRPRVLILDEPTSGLDPVHQRDVLDLAIEAATNGATVIFSSHQVAQVERAADRVAIMRRGRLVVDRVIDDLKSDEKIIEAVFAGEVPELGDIPADPRIIKIERVGSTLRATTRDSSNEIAQRIFMLQPRSIRTIDLNLEDIFMNAVSEDARL